MRLNRDHTIRREGVNRAPAAAQAFAIAHAMLRLFATPKTTPVFPAKTWWVIDRHDTRISGIAKMRSFVRVCCYDCSTCFFLRFIAFSRISSPLSTRAASIRRTEDLTDRSAWTCRFSDCFPAKCDDAFIAVFHSAAINRRPFQKSQGAFHWSRGDGWPGIRHRA